MPAPSLTTCCAHCRTVFRVTTAQLQAHAGQVRCGRCMQVFNALAALAPEAATADRGGVPDSASPPPPLPVETETPMPATPEAPAPVIPEAEPETVPASPAMEVAPVDIPSVIDGPEAVPEPVIEQTDSVATISPVEEDIVVDQTGVAAAIEPDSPDTAAVVEPDAVHVTDTETGLTESARSADSANPFTQEAEPEASPDPRRRGFVVAGVVLVLLLAGQSVFFYRSEIAARHPLAKQWLASLCAQAGCTLTLPQRPQAILIEASDLQVMDPANPNRIQLTATLRNHAGHDVAYPALDLVLTNVNDHTLARRIFLPQEYLGATRDVRTGIAANAELTVRLALETGNLGAAGFRLAVLSAPEQ